MTKIKNFIYAIYCYWKHFLANRQGIWILMYHHVNDSLPPSDECVSTKTFGQQMRYLRRYCNVISLEEVYDIYSHKKAMKRSRKPQVVITFDDGFQDNYENAYPVLKKLRLPATIFLTTGWIRAGKKRQSDDGPYFANTLSWDELKTMQNGNIIYSLHTKTHPHLPRLNREDQMREIKSDIDSFKMNHSIEIKPYLFSYTYGEYNQVTLEVLREIGVKLAVTVKEGMNTLRNDPLELFRICVDGRSGLVNFMRKLSPDIREVWHGLFRRKTMEMNREIV